MCDRRDFILGSAAVVATSLLTPAFAQTTTAAAARRGFLERPGCRVYYEVTGAGPAIIFAHGIGSNHLTWWQQVPHFSDRYTCVTFAHRGYPPSSEIGVPDPKDFAGDLAALIGHLQFPNVRLVAQSWVAGPASNTSCPFPTQCVRSYLPPHVEQYTYRPCPWLTRNG